MPKLSPFETVLAIFWVVILIFWIEEQWGRLMARFDRLESLLKGEEP